MELASTTRNAAPPTMMMAAAAGIAVANIYYNQPMLGLIARDFPGSGVEGLIPAVTQLGYAAGLLFLVPLGDLLERRKLIVAQFGLLALALLLTAAAPTVPALVAASVLLGASATVAQQIVPFAAHLAPPERRGAVVGTVMAGLLGGILLSRTLAGLIASQYGWRDMYWIAVPVIVLTIVAMALLLPHSRPDSKAHYGTLLKSLLHLWRQFAELRWAALTQALLFASFSAFWTTLSLLLEQPKFGLGSSAAGLFGIVGLAGVMAAPAAGRLADRHGPHLVVMTGAVAAVASWLLFGLWSSLIGLVVGVIVLDFGIQSALVSNQHIIFSLKPEARARLNTVFMGCMFLGGAAGSAVSTVLWRTHGWTGVSVLGIAFSLLAAGVQILARRARHTL